MYICISAILTKLTALYGFYFVMKECKLSSIYMHEKFLKRANNWNMHATFQCQNNATLLVVYSCSLRLDTYTSQHKFKIRVKSWKLDSIAGLNA